MKRVIHILLSVAAVFAFFSCDNGEGLEIDAAKTLKVVDSDLLFSPDGVGAGVSVGDGVGAGVRDGSSVVWDSKREAAI